MRIEIKLKDFPDEIYLKLDKNFTMGIFEKVKKKISQRELAKKNGSDRKHCIRMEIK